MKTLKLTKKDFKQSDSYWKNYIGKEDVSNYDGNIEIESNLGLVRFVGLSAIGSISTGIGTDIKTGTGIQVGWGIKAGESIEAERPDQTIGDFDEDIPKEEKVDMGGIDNDPTPEEASRW